VRWPLFGIVVLVAFFLGYVGFAIYFEDHLTQRGTTDLAYLSLQLLTATMPKVTASMMMVPTT
jgi:hypothetical protein